MCSRSLSDYFLCSEDQWDIYKLDPAYECFVPTAPDHPTVMRKNPSFDHMYINQTGVGSTLPTNSKKRRVFSPVVDEERSAGPSKKFRSVPEEDIVDVDGFTSSDEEDEVEEIVVDEEGHEIPRHSDRTRLRQKDREEQARAKRRKPAAQGGSATGGRPGPRASTPEIVDLTMEDSSSQEPSHEPSPESTLRNDITATGTTKRKGENLPT